MYWILRLLIKLWIKYGQVRYRIPHPPLFKHFNKSRKLKGKSKEATYELSLAVAMQYSSKDIKFLLDNMTIHSTL